VGHAVVGHGAMGHAVVGHGAVEPRTLLTGKTVKPEAASSSDTDNIYKMQQSDIHRHCCPTMHQAVRMFSNSTYKLG
jgi:hypothetical protein